MTTFSDGSASLTPIIVDGWEQRRRSRTVEHEVIGRADGDYSLAPLTLRKGILIAVCASLSDGAALERLHAGSAVLSVVDPDHPELAMDYVVTPGREVLVTLDRETRELSIVEIPYSEVLR